MKRGVILAGGLGTRLQPITRQINKHLVPILNKPMVMYPLETLKSFGITDIMIVSGGGHIGDFADFFGDGSEFGVSLTYRAQKEAGGIAQALFVAEDFANGEQITVILGDNIFGEVLPPDDLDNDACIYVKKDIEDKERFGVLRGFSEHYLGLSKTFPEIIEKPQHALHEDMVITGLYVYPPDVFDIIRGIKPSLRGELEISEVNKFYLSQKRLTLKRLYSSTFWSDAGTPESLYRAIKYVAEKDGLSTD